MTFDELKPIPGYEGVYSISPEGKVWGHWLNKWRKLSINQNGYPYVSLWDGTRLKRAGVHRLVAEAFIPNPDNKRCVNHKNGIKTDARIENLEWSTHSENTRHAIKTGLLTIRRGEKVAQAKFTEKDVIAIRQEYATTTVTQAALSRRFKVDTATMCNLLNRKSWRYL